MKKLFFIFTGFLIVGLLIFFNYYTRLYFDTNDKIIHNLNKLKQYELELDYEVLNMNLSLYTNFDNVVKLEHKIDKVLDDLSKDNNFKQNQSYKLFLEYKKNIKQKISEVYELEILLAPIKNSTMYIATLMENLLNQNISLKDKNKLLTLSTNILLSKNSLDNTFLKTNILLKPTTKYEKVYIQNIELFNQIFPKYLIQINDILNFNTHLDELIDKFLFYANKKLTIITIVSVLLILFVILSITIILYLFFKLEKENKILEQMAITDDLTKLYNRYKLQKDLENFKGVLFIVNIDRFKYYNDLYGTKVGDFILKEVGHRLKELLEDKATIYRIGGDDFGILFEKVNIKPMAEYIIDYFKANTIKYQDLEFYISLSIGISDTIPLLETADIALKSLKNDRKKNYAIYNLKFHQKDIIKDNFEKTNILKEAIRTNNIIPFYQPIICNKTKLIVKYEVLARVKTNYQIMSIYPFLKIAKENKLYRYITKMIYRQAFDKFKNKNIEFSLNISIDDINDEETMNFVYKIIEQNKDMMKYVTFEILEDDAISDYTSLKEFIDYVKNKGAKIAIDDFGSGYSNFSHVLNLDIDFLKIDGSLIKDLDKDEKMFIIVETIVNFSKKTNIQTIAEFVHNKSILDIVEKLEIDYSQGFYLGKPSEDI